MRYSFSLLRLLLAIGALSAVLALTKPADLTGAVVAFVPGIALAVLVLVATRRDVAGILRSVAYCGTGTALGLLLCPSSRPQYEPPHQLPYGLAGAILGAACAFLVSVARGLLAVWRSEE